MIADRAFYRRVMGDRTSFDGDIDGALADAGRDAEEFTHRHFELASRTETLRLYANGRCYPSAFPIVSVQTPNASIDGAAIVFGYGFAAQDEYAQHADSVVHALNGNLSATATVTYTGGYTPEQMPLELKRCVCTMAWESLHPYQRPTGIPAGATSMRMGDAAISGGVIEATAPMTHSVMRRLSRYRRAMVEGY